MITSPNNINEANLLTGECEAFSGPVPMLPSVTVQKIGSRPSDAVEVYVGTGIDVPLWLDDYKLRITIIEAGAVKKSLHRFGDITVIYQLADSLLEVNFLSSLNRYEHYWINEINGEKDIREVDRVRKLEDLQKRLHELRENYREFIDQWAIKNVSILNIYKTK